MTVDAAFFDWLAGFVDGEGSFWVHRGRQRGFTQYSCRMSIGLREDDEAILREIASRVGHGTISRARVHPSGSRSLVYTVSSKAGCARLVDIFDAHPLRAKKARDYAVWREAVLYRNASAPGRLSTGTEAYLERMETFRDAVKATRSYEPLPEASVA